MALEPAIVTEEELQRLGEREHGLCVGQPQQRLLADVLGGEQGAFLGGGADVEDSAAEGTGALEPTAEGDTWCPGDALGVVPESPPNRSTAQMPGATGSPIRPWRAKSLFLTKSASLIPPKLPLT